MLSRGVRIIIIVRRVHWLSVPLGLKIVFIISPAPSAPTPVPSLAQVLQLFVHLLFSVLFLRIEEQVVVLDLACKAFFFYLLSR